jgi:hypothetical protein
LISLPRKVLPMTTRQRPSLLTLAFKAPFFIGFLALLYVLGLSLLERIEGFALALGFSAGLLKVSTYALLFLFALITTLVLIRYLSRHD